MPNYKSSRILGLCLNVMGLRDVRNGEIDRSYYVLRSAVLAWTRRNYLRLRQMHPDVAKSCLSGGISFDDTHNRLVKTYAKGLILEPDRVYLELLPPQAEAEGA